jgi:hypothetical protein
MRTSLLLTLRSALVVLLFSPIVLSGLLRFVSANDGQNQEEKTRTSREGSPKGDAQDVRKLEKSIILAASPVNSVQIKAIPQGRATVLEIQLGGGSNQPPSNTHITGQASTVVGEITYSGYYRLSTEPAAQLHMKIKASGKKPRVDRDEYSFLTGHDVLKFEFAPTTTFVNPWLTGQITLASATQQLPGEDNGDEHPPILLTGTVSTPTGGSLASDFGSGDSLLTLNVGGNQRLAPLELGNTLSGMNLDKGSRYSPSPTKGLRKE